MNVSPTVASILFNLNKATRELIDNDRCTVYIVDQKSQSMNIASADASIDIVLPLNKGIAGYVATTGKTQNIDDAYLDDRFDQTWDKKSGYRTKSMLVMAVWPESKFREEEKDVDKKPIAVVQVWYEIFSYVDLINKMDEKGVFTKEDEQLLSVLLRFLTPQLSNNALFSRKKKKTEFEKMTTLGSETLVRQPSRELSSPRVIANIIEETEVISISFFFFFVHIFFMFVMKSHQVQLYCLSFLFKSVTVSVQKKKEQLFTNLANSLCAVINVNELFVCVFSYQTSNLFNFFHTQQYLLSFTFVVRPRNNAISIFKHMITVRNEIGEDYSTHKICHGCLTALKSDGSVGEKLLLEKEQYIFGSNSSQSDIVVEGDNICSAHMKLWMDHNTEEMWIWNISENGELRKNKNVLKAGEKVTIANKDRIAIGNHTFVIESLSPQKQQCVQKRMKQNEHIIKENTINQENNSAIGNRSTGKKNQISSHQQFNKFCCQCKNNQPKKVRRYTKLGTVHNNNVGSDGLQSTSLAQASSFAGQKGRLKPLLHNNEKSLLSASKSNSNSNAKPKLKPTSTPTSIPTSTSISKPKVANASTKRNDGCRAQVKSSPMNGHMKIPTQNKVKATESDQSNKNREVRRVATPVQDKCLNKRVMTLQKRSETKSNSLQKAPVGGKGSTQKQHGKGSNGKDGELAVKSPLSLKQSHAAIIERKDNIVSCSADIDCNDTSKEESE
ncbi:adenylate/guanylate cyclase [Reticulomyxa filosa]|uniref:Adenylate/guanylate cyclase n=1 Tax=Reticulomyxa filosa TaxID=46433 RepID=X6NSI4_RETFI|nr:adenylate/guanylate cyclase [Reticulomyxa filosa]|eukprot:ETO28868.1 adenylate/guanylate cyclase [Reticulomyxa filosa]